MANWPDGTVCGYCYMAAKRTRGRCPCGHDGVLPGRDSTGRPTCRSCSGIHVNVDCRRCGAEDELYRSGSCWRCVLGDEIRAVLADSDGNIPDRLESLAAALQGMKRSNS
ncbi:MAG: Fis family transcriptional regulator, partial [Mycobacterium sp.]